MNKRFDALIAPFKDDIEGARVLDLASHDGRWCYAFAGAGAASVVGIEGRQEMVDKFGDYPDAALRDKIELRVGDLFEGMEAAIKNGETYDVVGVFGILYHVMDHFRLFQLVRKLQPKLVIVDSEFMPLLQEALAQAKATPIVIQCDDPEYDGPRIDTEAMDYEAFLAKAPEHVVAEQRERLEGAETEKAKLADALKRLAALDA